MQEISIHPKGWGREEWIVNNKLYCGKKLVFEPFKKCSLHFHKKKDETFYIIKGKALITIGNNTMLFGVGDAVRIKPRVKHRVFALSHLEIIEFSTTHYETDSYRIIKGD